MRFTAQQLAELLNAEVEGDPNVFVTKLSKIEEGEPNSICFLANELYTKHIYDTDASVVIVNKTLQLERSVKETCTLLRVEDARTGLATLLEAYDKLGRERVGIEQPSFISTTASVGENVFVGAFAYVGDNVKLGNNVQVHPNCHIAENCTIGDNTILQAGVKVGGDAVIGMDCTIHCGAVIGCDGFGFAPNSANNYRKVIHTGNVVIEDHVEIGANTTIDRALMGSTIIRKGVKLDNLIQVAHNVEIGENTVIAAQSGVAGSTKVGRDCMIGGQVGIIGHLTIADHVKVAAQSGIGQSIKEKGVVVQGSPAFGVGEYRRSYVMFRRLPKIKEAVDRIKKELEELKPISE